MTETEKPKAIVLGGTHAHIALVENLKRRGYHTVLVDYYENPPAREAADEHIRESTLDKEKVLEIAKKINAKLVISACVDQANATACYVAEKLGLPAPYSYDVALSVTDKNLMKRIMIQNGIPTARHARYQSFNDFRDLPFMFPLIVKPVDSCGSSGVRRADNLYELEGRFSNALSVSRKKEVIIEEFIDGIEISLDVYVKNQLPYLIMIREKLINRVDKSYVIQNSGSITPARIPVGAEVELRAIIQKIVNVFNLETTSLLVQAIVNNHQIKIIEFAARVGGGMSYLTVRMNTGFDLIDATVDSYFGVNTEMRFSSSSTFLYTNVVYAYESVFSHVSGHEKLISDGIIQGFYPYKTKGMLIASDLSTRSRIGAFIVKAPDRRAAFQKARLAINTLEVYDMNNKPIMRRDIYPELNEIIR